MSASPAACTIVSNNYLAFARVFATSFLEHHVGGRVIALVVDEPAAGVDYDAQPFDVVFASELALPAFRNYAFRYSILEFNTAVKPAFLRLLGEDFALSSVCYFDPDILVMASLESLYRSLAEYDLLLTPHITEPLDDDKKPSERDLLRAGVYNLGFLGLQFNPQTREFLEWWAERLRRDCSNKIAEGLFVDQKWMDLAACLLPRVRIERDPAYNVAYWNLAHRDVRSNGNEWQVEEKPLRFFHFSGFDPSDPESLSKHQDRFTLGDRPTLRPLFDEYRRRLGRAGWEETRSIEYAYGRFDNGVAIPSAARWLLQRSDPEGTRWADPFATDGEGTFFEWLCQPQRQSATELPRIALALWESREDLRAAFPLQTNERRLAYGEWLLGPGGAQAGFDQAFQRSVEEAMQRACPATASAFRRSPLRPTDRGAAGAGTVAERLTVLEPSARSWWAGPAGYEETTPLVPRLALEIRRHRPDLLEAFPDPLGTDRVGFCRWYVTWGRWEYRLPRAYLRSARRSMRRFERCRAALWWAYSTLVRRRPWRVAPLATGLAPEDAPSLRPSSTFSGLRVPGVDVVGWPASPTGVGASCRATLAALRAAGKPFRVYQLPPPELLPAATAAGKFDHDLILYHVNADMMPVVAGHLGVERIEGRRAVGIWYWELLHIPLRFAASFRFLDEVWAPSRFCETAFSAIAPVPVRWVPPCVEPPTAPPLRREELRIPAGSFCFFNCFDLLSVPERKNPMGLLEALERASRASQRPLHLVLKVNHGDRDPGLLEHLRRRAQRLPVTIVDEVWSRARIEGAIATADAYISLHRSEGLGMPLIEAAYLGKPLLATGYGGSTDFLDESTGWPVRFDLVQLDRAFGPYPEGSVWADPDLEHAAELMIEVAEGGEDVRARATRAAARARQIYSPEAAGGRLVAEIERMTRSAAGKPSASRETARMVTEPEGPR